MKQCPAGKLILLELKVKCDSGFLQIYKARKGILKVVILRM